MAGDPDGVMAALYTQSLPRLGSFGYLLTGSYSEAEELVQAAIVKTFVRNPKLPDVPRAEAYVRAAMRTIHIDGLRRRERWARLVPRSAAADAVRDSQDDAADRDAVGRALAMLAPRVRIAVVLHYVEDLSIADVAEQMRLSEGTVKGYLKDARGRLAGLLGETHDDTVAVVAARRSKR